MRISSLSLAFVFALSAISAPAPTATPERAVTPEKGGCEAPAAAAAAHRFTALFLAGDHQAARQLFDDKMRAALESAEADRIRAGLEAQHGPVAELGEAWLERSRHGGGCLFRVPVAYARQKIDLRITLDAAGRVAGFFLVPHKPSPDDRPDPPPGVREVDVAIGAGPAALAGTLSLPAGDGPFPAVVLVHGSGALDRDHTIGGAKPFRDLAWGLAQRGIAALRYDKRSWVHPGQLAALGGALTVQEEVIDDAREALELLARGRREVDPERLYLAGYSLGGALVPRIAIQARERDEVRVAGLVVLAGSTLPLPETIVRQARHLAAVDGEVDAREAAQLNELEADMRALRAALGGATGAPADGFFGVPFGYYQDLEAHDPAALAAELGVPVLILQGARDYQVTMEDFARWREALDGEPGACLSSYSDLDHLFRPGEGASKPADYRRPGEMAEKVIEDVAGWLRDRECG